MGILTHLHSANSQILLEWRARGTGISTEGQSSAASHWYLNVCLPPGPLSALQPLAFWLWNFTHRGKNQKLLHAFCSKEKKKNQEDAWHEINWTGCSNNWIFNENFICSKCFSSPPSHCIIPAAPRQVLWAQPDHPGVRCHLQAEILGSCSVCAPAFELHLCREPNTGSACAALEWTSLCHLWFQTSSTFAREIQT